MLLAHNSLRLLYDEGSFLVVNTSAHPLDISDVVFERTLPDGSQRRFEAKDWARRALEPPTHMIPQGCYQLVRAEANASQPSTDVCPHFLGWFSTGLPRRYFWIADEEDAHFTVRLAGEDTPLGECAIDAGSCIIYLPED